MQVLAHRAVLPDRPWAPAQAQTNVAKAVCDACSVRAQCLDYALAANAQYGVFGGMSEEERREVRRRVGHRYELAAGGLEESA